MANDIAAVSAWLKEHPEDLDKPDPQGNLPIHMAAIGSHIDCFEFLIKQGARPDHLSTIGRNALHYACAVKCHSVVEHLMQLQNLNPQNPEGLEEQKNQDRLEELEVIVTQDHQALKNTVFPPLCFSEFINHQDDRGNTPLHVAMAAPSESIIALLIQHGTNPHLKNKNGNTALNVAAYQGHLGPIKLLLEAGADPRESNDEGATAIDFARQSPNPHAALAIAYLEEYLLVFKERDLLTEASQIARASDTSPKSFSTTASTAPKKRKSI